MSRSDLPTHHEENLSRGFLSDVSGKEDAAETVNILSGLSIAEIHERDEDGNTLLHRAVLQGDSDMLRMLLEAGAHPLSLNNSQQTPLHQAIVANQEASVRLLLEYGADPSIETKDSQTCLALAVESNSDMILEQLLCYEERKWKSYVLDAFQKVVLSLSRSKLLIFERHGLNLNMVGIFGSFIRCSSLRAAAASDDCISATRYILNAGINPNITDHSKFTALHVAANLGCRATVTELLRAGANPNARDNDSDTTPLFAAVQSQHIECVLSLLDAGADIKHIASPRGLRRGILHVAAQGPSVEIVRMLIARGADVNLLDERGASPASMAAQKGHVELLRLFRDSGIDIINDDLPDSFPLLAAALDGQVGAVNFLLDAGAPISTGSKTFSYRVPYAAIQGGHTSIVRILISKGFKIDATALHKAFLTQCQELFALVITSVAEQDHWWEQDEYAHQDVIMAIRAQVDAFVELYLENGFPATSLDEEQRSKVLLLAAQRGNLKLLQLALDHTSNRNVIHPGSHLTPLHLAALSGNERAFIFLWEAGFKVHGETQTGQTVLHSAALNGHVNILQRLAGTIKVDIKDCDGSTPLHWAARHGHLSTVTELTLMGSTVDLSNKAGKTPLHLACEYGHLDIVRHLVTSGSNVRKIDKQAKNALTMAIREEHFSIIEYLISLDSNLINVVDSRGFTGLSFARSDKVTTLLLENGAELSKNNLLGLSCWEIAVAMDNATLVRHLFEKQLQNPLTQRVMSQLYIGASHSSTHKVFDYLLANHTEAIELLNENTITAVLAECTTHDDEHRLASILRLMRKRDLKISQSLATHLLVIACGKVSFLETVRILAGGAASLMPVSRCPHINERRSPLLVACIQGNRDIVETLLERGANPHDIDPVTGFDAVELAAEHKHHDIVSSLHRYTWYYTKASLETCSTSSWETVSTMCDLEDGLDDVAI